MKEIKLKNGPLMTCNINDVDKMRVYNKLNEARSASMSGSGSFVWGSGKGNCFFNCMACIGVYYNVNYSSEEFEKKYKDASFWGNGGNVQLGENGAPLAYYTSKDGTEVPNPDAAAYLREFFDTKGDSWKTSEEDIDNYIKNNKAENKGTVMGVIKTGDRTTHAVILSSKSGNYYEYNDPTTGQRDVKATKSEIIYAIKIYGKKKEE